MKNFILFILLISSLFSCSKIEYKRHYARNIASEYSPLLSVEEVLSFSRGKLIDQNQNFLNRLKIVLSKSNVDFEFKYNSLLPSHVAYEIKALFNEERPIIEISYSHDVEFDQDAFQEVYLFLSNITERRYKNINSFFEIYYNAKNNHINSLKTLAKIRRDAFTFSDDQHLYDPSFIERNANKQNEWQEIINHFNEQELKQNTLDKITVENHRNLLSRLDNLTLDEQLLNLVATNNRQAVYDLINSYLPWTELSPFEMVFWKKYLDSIINPLPKEKRVLFYKPIQSEYVGLAKLPEFKDHSFLITGLLANETGSWNKRLRQLEFMNKKFIGIDPIHSTDEYSKAARISNMFNRHALISTNSPFMSVNPTIEAAFNVNNEKIMLLSLDPSTIFYNFNSDFPDENEYLIPLIVFPDEFVSFFDASKNPGFENTFYLERIKLIENHLKGISVTPEEMPEEIQGEPEAPETTTAKGFVSKNSKSLGENIKSMLRKDLKHLSISERQPAGTSEDDSEKKGCMNIMKAFF